MITLPLGTTSVLLAVEAAVLSLLSLLVCQTVLSHGAGSGYQGKLRSL